MMDSNLELFNIEVSEDKFRFLSKEDYEKELVVLILEQQEYRRKKNKESKRLSDRYEELMDEYVRFTQQ